MSVDLKFVELMADVLEIFFIKSAVVYTSCEDITAIALRRKVQKNGFILLELDI